MSLFDSIKNYVPFSGGSKNPQRQTIDSNAVKRNLSNYIAPVQLQRLRQDVQSWREVMTESENIWFPHRVKAQRLYIDTVLNGHVAACMDRRKDLTMLRKWEFVDKDGNVDQATTDIFCDTVKGKSQNKEWFNKFIHYAFDSIFYGYSLISLGNIINNEFPELDLIKRWNVSPDRLNVTNFTYSISGALFMEEPYKNWHVYVKTLNDIGTSPAGYGLLYKVGIYEIFLRNILGYNGDFVELYSQPFRVGKTTKTEEKERNDFAESIQQMGSAGWAMIDPEDEIAFIETALGGTGYQGYDNFEQRLEKKISKIILGHADAIDSVPGKLGNSGAKNPAELAMDDKQTRDGAFISNVVNKSLFENMKALGFNIPDGVVAVLKNDAEIQDNNNAVIAQAKEMAAGNLTMDAEYFTAQTGIKVAAPVINTPSFSPSIKNRLEQIYNKHKH